MGKIFFTSDLHLNHNRDFIYKPRGFNNIEEHDKGILRNLQAVVNPEDDLYILGDLFLGVRSQGYAPSLELLDRLPGKVHFIYGNHDTIKKQMAIQELIEQHEGWESLGYGSPFKYRKYHFFLSHYPNLTYNFDSNSALRRQCINLCGHCHTKDKFLDIDKGLIYHVELDAHGSFPIEIEDIIADIMEYKTKINQNA